MKGTMSASDGKNGGAGKTRPDALAPGTLVAGKFEILEILSQSSSSSNYKARAKDSGELFALRILHSSFKLDEELFRRVKGLTHRNLLGFSESGNDEKLGRFLLRPYVNGKTLADLLKEKQVLNQIEFVDTFLQVCTALSFLRRKGIVHGNIKPSNLIFNEDFQLFLLDLNVCLKAAADKSSISSFFNPAYQSPEYLQGESIDPSSDIYSSACCMYECLAGKPPFQAESSAALSQNQIKNKAVPFQSLMPARKVDESLERLIFTCLEKDPRARYQFSEDLECDLKRIQSGEETKGPTKPGTASKKVIAAVAVAAMILIGLAGIAFKNYLGQTEPAGRTATKANDAELQTMKKEEKEADEHMRNKRYDQACELYNKLEPVAKAKYGNESMQHLRLLHKLAKSSLLNQEEGPARDTYTLLCEILKSNPQLAPRSFSPVAEIFSISRDYFESGQFKAADEGFSLATNLQNNYGNDTSMTYKSWIWRGRAELANGNPKAGMRSLRVGIQSLSEYDDDDYLAMALEEYTRAICAVAQSDGLNKRDKEKGLTLLERALKQARKRNDQKAVANLQKSRKILETARENIEVIEQ